MRSHRLGASEEHAQLLVKHAWLQERHRLAMNALEDIVVMLHQTLHDMGPVRECSREFCRGMAEQLKMLRDEELPDAGDQS